MANERRTSDDWVSFGLHELVRWLMMRGRWHRCVLTAAIGIATVTWYAMGGVVTEEEMEEEVLHRMEEKKHKGRFFGLIKKRT